MPDERQPREKAAPVKERYDAAKAAKGRWRDVVYKKGPDGKDVVVEDSGWRSNLIVVGMPKLLAGLMANETTFLGGIRYHAQGRGDPAWDIPGPPVPGFNSVKLVAEFFRKVPDAITYLDPDGNPSTPVTNSILIRTTLDYNEANGPGGTGGYIREQGIFGGTATGDTDSGIMANLIYHRARWKDQSVRLVRFINFIF